MTSRSRKFLQEQEHQASWDRLRNAPWDPLETTRAWGSGLLRVQVIYKPSFSSSSMWELCERGSKWVLYRSNVVKSLRSPIQAQGYEAVPFESDRLKAYFQQLTTLSIPIAPELRSLAGADGEMTQLALFGFLDSEVRFQWWSDTPIGWEPMTKIVATMLQAFHSAADDNSSGGSATQI